MNATTRGCRTKSGKISIKLQILNGASPIKFNQVRMSVTKRNQVKPGSARIIGGKFNQNF